MKRLLLLIVFTFGVSSVYSQSCDAGGCSNFNNQYPAGTFTTTSSTFTTVSTLMNAGNWTLFNVTSGNTYEWTYCNDFSPALQNWNAELTLYNNANSQLLCYQNNCNRTNCPNAPYLSWTATFTGTVKLLTSVSSTSNCMTNTGSPYSTLVWRQSAQGCSGWTVTPSSTQFSSTGGNNSFAVTTTVGGCNFSALSNNSWINNITYPGGGTVSYHVDANSGQARSGTISIKDANQISQATFTVNQSAASCTYNLSSTNSSFLPSSGGSGNFSIQLSSGSCTWSISSYPSWLSSLSPLSGNGTTNVSFAVGNNSNVSLRSEDIIFQPGNLHYTVNQNGTGLVCSYTITPSSIILNSSNGTYSFNVNTSSGCNWSASPSQSWVHSASSGNGNGICNYSVDQNNGTNSRQANIFINGQPFSVTQNGASTITINSADVQPWQRANEASIVVSANCTSSDASQWEFTAYNPVTNLTIHSSSSLAWFNSNSGSHSWTLPISFYQNPTMPQQISYSVVNISGASKSLDNPFGKTTVIEAQWVNQNVVYFNNGNNPLKIPLKYFSNLGSIDIIFTRLNDNSHNPCGLIPEALCGQEYKYLIVGNGLNIVAQYGSNQYFTIDRNDNVYNLKTVEPGNFSYHINYHNNVPQIIGQEDGSFELTKIGKINNSVNNNALVFIGGWESRIEHDIANPTNNGNINSEQSFSIANYSGWSNFSTWYIAQPNTNYTQLNAYSIGLALETIKSLEGYNEINIICHSKGGLEMRSLMSGYALSFQEFQNTTNNNGFRQPSLTSRFYDFQSVNINLNIKKVAFLATPHEGANSKAEILDGVQLNYGSPALKELRQASGYKIINQLRCCSSIPNGLKIANITAYNSSTSYQYSSTLGYLQSIYNLDFLDGPVNGESSDAISNSNPANPQHHLFYYNGGEVPVIQMYQHDPHSPSNPLGMPHIQIHTNKCLTNVVPNSYSVVNQTINNNNLQKIINFINDIQVSSCPRPSQSDLNIQPVASILSGASIFRKFINDSVYYQIGITDENGELIGTLIPALSFGDSVKIEAAGYESLIIAIDSEIINTEKIKTSMLKSLSPSSKIKYPSLKLINQNPITSNNSITLELTGENIQSFEINNPLNQDSIFIPLILNNNQFVSQLDTGYNLILVRLIGTLDTIILSKRVDCFPGILMNDNTFEININTTNSFIGAKVYIDNLFSKYITSAFSTIKTNNGSREIRFCLFGYHDSVFDLDSSLNINLSMIPIIYSSETDSALLNFDTHGNLQYWKNITVRKLNSTMGAQLVLKQCADSLTNTGLVPMSRCFEFKNISATHIPIIQTAICLDQATKINKDSTYLLITKDDSIYSKAFFDSTGICNFDSVVQKLTYDSITFNSGQVTIEEIRIMKRLAPILITPNFTLNQNDSITIPLQNLFVDPDSIKNDMTFQIGNVAVGLIVQIVNGNIKLKSESCAFGNLTFSINATHDGLTRMNVFNVTVNGNTNMWLAVAKGNANHMFALKSNGTLWSWGLNASGALGNGTTQQSATPTQMGNLTNWIKVATGGSHTIALKADGTIWTWGYNAYGQLGIGSADNNPHSNPIQVGLSTNWIFVAGGGNQTFAIKSDGTLWSWGYNAYGQLGDGTTNQRNIPVQIGSANNWVDIACGYGHTLALKSDGTLWSWGWNSSGQLGNGTTAQNNIPTQIGSANNWINISCGEDHSLAINSIGELWAWGQNTYGKLGDGSTTNRLSPVKINSTVNWQNASGGSQHTIGQKSDGSLWAWGNNSYGQLGDGTLTQRLNPIQINSQSNVIIVKANLYSSASINNNRTLICMTGRNNFGGLGDGSTVDRNTLECVISSGSTVLPIPTISTGSITPLTYCPGNSITVPFTTTSAFCNYYTAQLSNSNGNFSNPLNIGSVFSNASGVINSTIPTNTVFGSSYRIRVISSNPSATGSINGSNIIVTPCASTLQAKLFIEGYYSGGGLMNNSGIGGCLFVNGIPNATQTDVDTIVISAMDAHTFSEVDRQKGIIHTNGTVNVTFNSSVLIGNSYYIKVNHRNAIETWSSDPVLISSNTSYDFTTAKSKAYGNNMTETFDHMGWALYSGDISHWNFGLGFQDGFIESQDYADMENAVYYTLIGYLTEDLTGDGIVESNDYGIMENNVYYTRMLMHP